MQGRRLNQLAIGYACITVGVQNTGLSRCILKNASEENIRKVIAINLSALEAMVDYNIKNGIKLFRISSDIIPFGSHSINTVLWWEDYKENFLRIGNKITSAGMRVSMHPGQYTVLNSRDLNVVEKAVKDLNYHAAFLDALGMDNKSKIILHIGGVYGDKENAIKAFTDQYVSLSQTIKNRLIIENDDKNYDIQDILTISQITGAPAVFDNLHHELNPPEETLSEFEWIKECNQTWKEQDGKQKIHYSQQKVGALRGSHSDTIFIPPFLDFYHQLLDNNIDIMLEVKDKNLSAIKCINTVLRDVSAKKLEEEWAKYKYFVLSRSARIYNDIRGMLKNKEARVVIEFYEKIEHAYLLSEDKGAEVNAAEHVWGYISKDSSSDERKRYEKLLDAYLNDTSSAEILKSHLLKCAHKRDLQYLINSLYFYI